MFFFLSAAASLERVARAAGPRLVLGTVLFACLAITGCSTAVTRPHAMHLATTRNWIMGQPEQLLVTNTGTATFTVRLQGSLNHFSFQWFFNGAALTNETGSTLTRIGVTTNDVGLYACQVTYDPPGQSGSSSRPPRQPESEMSQPGTLSVFQPGSLIVAGVPILGSGGTAGGCPAPYRAYINFRQSDGTGFVPQSSTARLQASFSERYELKWFGTAANNLIYSNCGVEDVYPTQGYRSYRFTAYVPTTATVDPAKAYVLTLYGFAPPK